MTTTVPDGDRLESCEHCDRDTPHTVDIQLRVESDKPENHEFSREPYRVSTCLECDETTTLRMNNA